MIDLVADHKREIGALCERYGIRRLDLFGSAATGAFDPATSDLDFVVDLGEYDDNVHLRYLGLIGDLQDRLGRSVHMVTDDSIRNPYFRASVEEQRVLLYEARDGKAAA